MEWCDKGWRRDGEIEWKAEMKRHEEMQQKNGKDEWENPIKNGQGQTKIWKGKKDRFEKRKGRKCN